MSAVTSRRELLRVGAATGGVFLLELVLPGCHAGPDPVQPTARPGDFVPNAWLRVTPEDKVFFTLDRVEMGQGTMTSHAQLVAEELAMDPSRLVVEFAVANRAYDNLGDARTPVQITGGSMSVRGSFEPLRRAGATAREMLRSAAARRWGVAAQACKAEDGAIVHVATGRRARYGELAADAAREPVPQDVALKPSSEFTWIGKDVPRLDARAKVTGSAVYGIDVVVPDMVNAVVLRPPVLRARLASFDAQVARGMAGVIDVFPIPQGLAIVAVRYWQARAAAETVRVEWRGGETWIGSEGLRKSYLERAARSAPVARSEGNVDRAERDAARVVEATYEFPYLAHAPLEPMNATAHVTEGRCEVWAPTQCPGLAREAVRRILGLSYDRIIINQTFVGGGFGRRLQQDYVVEAVEVARRVKRPVKVTFSREDEMRSGGYRPMVVSYFRGAIGKDGAITSFFHRVVAQSIAAAIVDEWAGAILPDGLPLAMKALGARSIGALARGNAIIDETTVEGSTTMAYAIPNVRVECASMVHPVPVASWRSVGNSHNIHAVECFFDELAHAAGKDPYLARRALLGGARRELGVLDLAADRIGWSRPPPPGRFRGIAQGMSFESYCAHAAEVSLIGNEVKVHRMVSAIDCGVVVNPDLVRMQIQSGVVFGLSAIMKQEITLRDGRVEQSNYHEFEPLRMHEMPDVEVHIVASQERPTGVGEPGVPPAGAAVANAVLQATGRPVRILPFTRGLAEAR